MNKIYYYKACIVYVEGIKLDMIQALDEQGNVLDDYEKKNMVEKGATVIPLRLLI